MMASLFPDPFSGVASYVTEYAGFIFLAVILIVVMVIAVFAYFR